MTATETTPHPLAPLADALSKAQGEMTAAAKDGMNPAFRSAYATLASVWDACRGPLTRHGLSVIQMPRLTEAGDVEVETMLLHATGAAISSILAAHPVKSDPQGIGSAITYLRRYGLMAMVGLAADDDDDGNQAASPAAPPRRAPRPAPTPPKPAPAAPEPAPADSPREHDPSWEADRARFCAQLADLGTDYETVAAYCGTKNRPRPSAMPQCQRDVLIDYLMQNPTAGRPTAPVGGKPGKAVA